MTGVEQSEEPQDGGTPVTGAAATDDELERAEPRPRHEANAHDRARVVEGYVSPGEPHTD
jgi:hypothetical protein